MFSFKKNTHKILDTLVQQSQEFHSSQLLHRNSQNQLTDIRNFNDELVFIKQQSLLDRELDPSLNSNAKPAHVYLNEEHAEEHNYVNISSSPSPSNNSSVLLQLNQNFSNSSSNHSSMKQLEHSENTNTLSDDCVLTNTLQPMQLNNQLFLANTVTSSNDDGSSNMSIESDTMPKMNFTSRLNVIYDDMPRSTIPCAYFDDNSSLYAADSPMDNHSNHAHSRSHQPCTSFSKMASGNHVQGSNLPISLTYRQTIAALPTSQAAVASLAYNRSYPSQSESSSCPAVTMRNNAHSNGNANPADLLPLQHFRSQDQTQYCTQIVPNTPKEIRDYYMR